MEENVSPELSLAPEPEQSQDPMDSCSQAAVAEQDKEGNEQSQAQDENAAKVKLEEPDKSSKVKSELKKTWGFRQTTIAKREMPGEAAADSQESRCPVRRSGRQSKRTDKLEEFLSTTKRGSRRSAPPSLESGDPPSQTPTDAETASEASFDGNADIKAVDDKAESPERRTRSSTKKQTPEKTQGGRQTRGRGAVKEDGSSENEEDGDGDAAKKTQSPDKDDEEKDEEKKEPSPEEVGSGNSAQPQPEQDSERKEVVGEEKREQEDETDKVEPNTETDKENEDESKEKPPVTFAKRGPIRTYANKKKAANNNTSPVNAAPSPVSKITTPVKREPKATPAAANTCNSQMEEEEEDEDEDEDDDEDDDESLTSTSSSSIDSDDGGYDPNALYCICRQKHNKRFMICCDRCEEWFHGDCVGITEARGRLMERNGEDYICPNCTAKKNQVVRPATITLASGTEIGKSKAEVTTAAVTPAATASATAVITDLRKLDPSHSPSQSAVVPSISTGTEEKGDDLGIKGRIEKAINPTGKKKIKIFQPAVQQTAVQKAEQKSTPTVEQRMTPKVEQKAATNAEQKATSNAEQKAASNAEQKVASNVELKTTPTVEQKVIPKVEEKTVQKAEGSSLPKCIGPGCENNAQPDSVYCGNDCILRHAAAAMKSITDVKEPKQKDKERAKTQKVKSTPKRSAGGRKKTSKKSTEEDESDSEESDPDYDDEDEHCEEHPPPPAAASWSSDHNYNAVTPEKTTPMSPTVLNKKCMYLFEGLDKSVLTFNYLFTLGGCQATAANHLYALGCC